MDRKKAADLAYTEGYRLGSASRDTEIQRLQFALADSEALELGTAERCDQLRAELVNALAACKAKDELLDEIGALNMQAKLSQYITTLVRKALAATPEQSLARYHNEVAEKCAKGCDAEYRDPHNLPAAIVAKRCADTVRAMKEPE